MDLHVTVLNPERSLSVGRRHHERDSFELTPVQHVASYRTGWRINEVVMARKKDLQDWVMQAIESLGGGGTVVEVSREVWRRHEEDLREAGDLFYTWQYDIRWAAQVLRDEGKLMPADQLTRICGRAHAQAVDGRIETYGTLVDDLAPFPTCSRRLADA